MADLTAEERGEKLAKEFQIGGQGWDGIGFLAIREAAELVRLSTKAFRDAEAAQRERLAKGLCDECKEKVLSKL